MWVSGKKFRELAERVHQLEEWKASHEADVVEGRNFTVYDPVALKNHRELAQYHLMGAYWHPITNERIHVKDVVQKILDKLDMELVYVGGTKATVAIKEKANVPA